MEYYGKKILGWILRETLKEKPKWDFLGILKKVIVEQSMKISNALWSISTEYLYIRFGFSGWIAAGFRGTIMEDATLPYRILKIVRNYSAVLFRLSKMY